MSFNDILYIVIVAIVIFFLLKAGLVILIVAIVICVIYYLFSAANTPTYNYNTPMYTYEEFNNVYQQDNYNDNTEPSGYINESWYGPVQQYYDISSNNNSNNESFCIVPGSTSEYCVHKQVQQGNNLNTAINNCKLSGSQSGGCGCN